MRIGVLELKEDVSPAAWVVDRIHPLGEGVRSLVPEGFEAYVRIFHPAHNVTAEVERTVRWAEIAEAHGRQAHPEMQFPYVVGEWPHRNLPAGSLWNHEPAEGCLPRDVSVVLAALLTRFTTTPDRCWFCVWDGFGGSKLPYEQQPKVELPQRTYHLLGGPIDGIQETFDQPIYPGPSRSAESLRRRWFFRRKRGGWWGSRPGSAPGRGWRGFEPVPPRSDIPAWEPWQSANLWWPDDRAWFVTTEIDLMSTYVGGSRACIDVLLAAPELEAMEAKTTHGISYSSDSINPPPDEPWR